MVSLLRVISSPGGGVGGGIAMNAVTDLNGAEKKLVKAAEHDTVADLRRRENGERPVIRARLLRELCTGHRQWDVKDRIRMSGGRVAGRLDPFVGHLAHPLPLTHCGLAVV